MRIFSHSALVVGTGAAGYACACRLKEAGVDVETVAQLFLTRRCISIQYV